MSMTTLNIFIATGNILIRYHGVVTDNLICILGMSAFLLSITGMNSLSIFSITFGMTNLECSNNDSYFGIKFADYGVIWIAFIEMFFIFFGVMRFLYYIILDAKLHELCEPCFDICKKYREMRIAVEPTMTNYNTDCVSIPISAFNEEKEPEMLCSVCYDGAITRLL